MRKQRLNRKQGKKALKAICNFLAACLSSKPVRKNRQSLLRNQSGQVMIEYILLLVVAVSIATLITKTLVGRGRDNPGIIVKSWSGMNDAIGADIID